MIVKIRSLAKLTFKGGNNYKFTSKKGATMNMNFISYSRIDGFPMFETKTTNQPSEPIVNFYYKNIKIDGATIVLSKEDHTGEPDYTNDFLDFIIDFHELNKDDLKSEQGFKKLKRQFKLNSLLE